MDRAIPRGIEHDFVGINAARDCPVVLALLPTPKNTQLGQIGYSVSENNVTIGFNVPGDFYGD